MITIGMVTRDTSSDEEILNRVMGKSEGYNLIRVDGNHYGLTDGYNVIAEYSNDDMIIFLHDDVQVLASDGLIDSLYKFVTTSEIGVVGVAGTRALPSSGVWWEQRDFLSGMAMHTKDRIIWSNSYGNYSQVVAVDGVFMAVKTSIAKEVGFSERYKGFDFYDITFSTDVHLAGYCNYTFPIPVIHSSMGDVSGKNNWHTNRNRFSEEYKEKLPLIIPFVPLEYSVVNGMA